MSDRGVLLGLVAIHVGVFAVAIFGGIVHRRMAEFNVLFFLPFVYAVQSLPLHPILTAKMDVTGRQPIDRTRPIGVPCSCERDRYAARLGITPEEYERRMRHVQESFPMSVDSTPAWMLLQAWLNNNSYLNPMGAQGMVILAFVVNVFALRFLHGVNWPQRSAKQLC